VINRLQVRKVWQRERTEPGSLSPSVNNRAVSASNSKGRQNGGAGSPLPGG